MKQKQQPNDCPDLLVSTAGGCVEAHCVAYIFARHVYDKRSDASAGAAVRRNALDFELNKSANDVEGHPHSLFQSLIMTHSGDN